MRPRVFSDPLAARFLSQSRRSAVICILLINPFPASLRRLAFNGIFAEWVPSENPKAFKIPLSERLYLVTLLLCYSVTL